MGIANQSTRDTPPRGELSLHRESAVIYFIAERRGQFIKIGKSKEPLRRVGQHQTSNARYLELLACATPEELCAAITPMWGKVTHDMAREDRAALLSHGRLDITPIAVATWSDGEWESFLHIYFDEHRAPNGEWFYQTPGVLDFVQIINSYLSEKKFQTEVARASV